MVYQPTDNDGYVDYTDTEDNVLFSIAIGDEEETDSLTVTAPQDDNIQRVIIGPALGRFEGVLVKKADMSDVNEGESGFLLGMFSDGNTYNYAALTQDGVSVITAKAMENNDGDPVQLLLDRQNAVTVSSLLKLAHSTPEGEVAQLPLVRVEIGEVNNGAGGLVLHAPYHTPNDHGNYFMFCNFDYSQIFWGDSVRQVYTN